MRNIPAYFFLLLLVGACRNTPAEAKASETAVPDSTAVEPVTDSIPVFPVEYLTGKFDPGAHPDFVPVDAAYAGAANLLLRREANEAFRRMHAAATEAGVKLTILSATRNFERQRAIWDAKWTGQRKSNGVFVHTIADPVERALEILKVSSMPGTSRHHWGTDVDLNAVNNRYFTEGEGKKVYEWLTTHAATYGFCQPYSAGRPTGYTEEKWHWSYLPLAGPLTRAAARQLTDEQINGFLGDETAVRIGVVEKYMLGINTDCSPR